MKANLLPYVFMLACAGAFGLPACGDKVNPAAKCDPELALRTVTYNGTIAKLLDAKCNGCHKSGTNPNQRSGATVGVNLDSYDNAVKWGNESREWIMGGLMPPTLKDDQLSPNDPNYAGLSTDQRCDFATWVRNGFPK